MNNKLGSLLGIVESAEARPTQQSYEVFEMLSEQLDRELEQLTQIIEQGLPQLNELLRALELEEIDITSEGNVPSDSWFFDHPNPSGKR